MPDLIIPDSRFEMPGLFLPGVKPVGKVKIDWEHPLASRIDAYYLMDGANLTKDLIGRSDGVIENDVSVGFFDVYRGAKFGATDDAINIGDDITNVSNSITISATIFNSSVAGLAGILGKRAGTTSAAQYSFGIEDSKLLFWFYSGGWYGVNSAEVIPGNEIVRVGMTYNKVNLKLFLNGKLTDSVPLTASLTHYSIDALIGKWSSNTGGGIEGGIVDLLFSRSALTDREMHSLHINPHQFLIPA